MTGSPPRISCLLPVYNGAQFIEEAIDSILAQSFTDFELVVVDDGSTDHTPDILAAYAARDARLRIVRQSNRGIVAALNNGLAVCQGEYVARMDADDVSEHGRFAAQAAYLDSHPRCVLVGGLAASYPPGTAGRPTSGGRQTRTDLRYFPPKVAVSMHPLITVRRAALVQIGGYRSTFPHAEDYDLFIRLAAVGTIDNPDRVMLFYRRHAGAISVRHVAEQERSAALAEVDAVEQAGFRSVPQWMVEAYVRLRRWRRYRRIDPPQAAAMRGAILRDLLTPAPRAVLSRRYWRLRALTSAVILRGFLERARKIGGG